MSKPSSNDVCLEPIIKYGYIYGIGYTKELSILGIVTHGEYNKLLSNGFGDMDDGERIWNQCKSLYNKYRNFAQMPQNIIEQKWIQSYETALWKLEKFLEWQQRSRIQITVPWQIGHKWRVGTHIRLSLLHIRGGEPLLCVCESIKKNNQHGRVSADLIFIDSIDASGPSLLITDDNDFILTDNNYCIEVESDMS